MLSIPAESFQLNPLCGKVFCEKNWRWETGQRPFEDFDLWYVWGGEGEIVLNLKSFSVSKGSCLLFRPGDHISGKHNPDHPLIVTFIHFTSPSEPRNMPEPYRLIVDTFSMESLLTRYVYLKSSNLFGAEDEAKLVLKQALIQLFREHAQEDDHLVRGSYDAIQSIHETASYISQNTTERHRVEDLAKRARLSTRYFTSMFKKMYGQTVESYMIQMRIERADYLLRYSGMNVSETAEAMGYQNVYFFSRQFKQYKGFNPSEIIPAPHNYLGYNSFRAPKST